jgi:hypothetical protein
MLSWLQVLKYWRWIVGLALLGSIGAYVRSAEHAKSELAAAHTRAAFADSLARLREAESAQYTQAIDSLKTAAQGADTRYQALLKRPPRKVFIPVEKPDSTTQVAAGDTIPVWEIPEVKEALDLCEERVEVRDRIIDTQDRRRVSDSLTIAELRVLAPHPPKPPKQPSVVRKVVLGAVEGLAVGVVAQQVAGQKGLIVSASLGAILRLFR